MSDGFEAMVDAAQPFFSQLRAQNTKDWFTPRKDHYISEIRKPAELFATLLAEDLARLTGEAHNAKVFRIYRDVRFSKDKSPYNAHLHILWSTQAAAAPSWFFALNPDSIWLGMGLLGLSGPMLTRYRQFVDAEGDALAQHLDALADAHGTQLSNFGPEPLKRVPKPYDQDHPQADLLRRKGLALGADLPATWRETGLTRATRHLAEAHLPLWRLVADRL
ncbi:MAG: TIGR02453 family protein [Pseudomonadota bacterium]